MHKYISYFSHCYDQKLVSGEVYFSPVWGYSLSGQGRGDTVAGTAPAITAGTQGYNRQKYQEADRRQEVQRAKSQGLFASFLTRVHLLDPPHPPEDNATRWETSFNHISFWRCFIF